MRGYGGDDVDLECVERSLGSTMLLELLTGLLEGDKRLTLGGLKVVGSLLSRLCSCACSCRSNTTLS